MMKHKVVNDLKCCNYWSSNNEINDYIIQLFGAVLHEN